MATKTNIELTANLQSGQIFIPAGRHTLPDSPYSDILQKEIDAGSRHITVLGTVDVAEEADDSGDDSGSTPTAPARGGRRKPTA